MQLAARQPWACGVACRWAVAFANLALAVREAAQAARAALPERRPRRERRGAEVLSEDQRSLIQARGLNAHIHMNGHARSCYVADQDSAG